MEEIIEETKTDVKEDAEPKPEPIAEPKPAPAPQQVTVGNIYAGRVLKIKPFGAIVSLPNSAPGLVHISQISSGYIQSVDDVLAVGDEVNVRVLSRDPSNGKISLSMKDIPQAYDDEDDYDEDGYYAPPPPVITAAQSAAFEEKFKAWQKVSNERIAGLNKRNKRR